MKITAAVLREKQRPFSIEQLELDTPQADEVVVRIVGVGVGHTDLVIRDLPYPPPLPSVLGHEGAGVIEAVGEHRQGLDEQPDSCQHTCRTEQHPTSLGAPKYTT